MKKLILILVSIGLFIIGCKRVENTSEEPKDQNPQFTIEVGEQIFSGDTYIIYAGMDATETRFFISTSKEYFPIQYPISKKIISIGYFAKFKVIEANPERIILQEIEKDE